MLYANAKGAVGVFALVSGSNVKSYNTQLTSPVGSDVN